jgi:serine/threonine protein phosphatase PrpC
MSAEARVHPAIPIEWGVATRALPGETESGDLHLVAPFAEGVLIAVMDGLGHGTEAAEAARNAAAALALEPYDTVTSLMQRCHSALRKTRGVVLSLASIDATANLMTWVGVGNVDGTLYHIEPFKPPKRESMPRRGGVVGYQMPSLRATTLPVTPGDTLIFATDGIGNDFSAEALLALHPQQTANHILGRHAKESDDALVLVARYLGNTP